MALPKGRSVVTAGFAAIAGAGVASSFTVFANSSTWYLVLVAVITLGVYPLLAGWLSPPLRNVALFPISILFALSVAWAIGGPLIFRFTSHLGHLRPHHILWWRGILWHSVWAG